MNHIQPIKRPINNSELIEWRDEHLDSRNRLDDFLISMSEQGITEDKALKMWLHNFGAIPPHEPDRLYQCNILNADVKLTVTVIKRNEILAGQRKYDVIKLNNLYIDTYDYTRKLTVNEKGEIVFKIQHEDLIQNVNNPNSYPLNYEDSDWFTNLSVDTLLSKLKIRIKPYTMPSNNDEPGKPHLFINSMDFMESSAFEFTDKQFEQKIFDKINEQFLKIESELK